METNKSTILSDNKDKTGIYQWKHKISGKIYIGSAFNLTDRLRDYYSSSELKRMNNLICRAIIHHEHSAFSLSILEYIDITNLSKEEARKKILEREQHYLDIIFSPEAKRDTYNILKTAGSLLGFISSPETRALVSAARKGKSHTPETRVKISEAKSGIPHLPETRAKISATLGGSTIYVYSEDYTLKNKFYSAREAGKHFNCCPKTIKKYAIKGELFQEQWILSLFAK
jgi:group I intron endonuclease